MSKPDVFLGVLAARQRSGRRPYHAQTTFFRRLIREGAEIGVEVFVFSPSDVLWKRRRIRGWTWTGQRWVRRVYRFPDAVYDRVSPYGHSDWRGVATVRRRLRRYGVPRFNTGVGDKWYFYRVCRKEPNLRPALPPTRRLSLKSLGAMMNRYGEVYIKPANGGKGKGVAWAKQVRGGYVYRVQGKRGSRSGRVRTLKALKSRCAGRRRSIVQMAIPVLRCRARSFDVRALVQRTAEGEWDVTGLVARLGGRKSRVTNIASGGRALDLRTALSEAGADEESIDSVLRRAESLALETAEAISTSPGTNVCELGIDIAIDSDLRCWLLEANSRTGRISFHRAGMKEAAAKADRAPAAYARYLAGRR